MSRRRRETPRHSFMDLARPGWRERAAHRKSPWKFVSMVLAFGIGGLVWYSSFRLMWGVHVLFFPAHAGHLSEFWPAGLRLRAFISSFLLLMPLGISSLIVGILTSFSPLVGQRRIWARLFGKERRLLGAFNPLKRAAERLKSPFYARNSPAERLRGPYKYLGSLFSSSSALFRPKKGRQSGSAVLLSSAKGRQSPSTVLLRH
jgi:hypothetical protein